MRINVCNNYTGHDLVLFANPHRTSACGTDGLNYQWLEAEKYWQGPKGDLWFETSRSEPHEPSPIPEGQIVIAVYHTGQFKREDQALAPEGSGTPWWPFDDPDIDTYVGTADALLQLAHALEATTPAGHAGFYNRKLAYTITNATTSK